MTYEEWPNRAIGGWSRPDPIPRMVYFDPRYQPAPLMSETGFGPVWREWWEPIEDE